jgi:hypothetical protein
MNQHGKRWVRFVLGAPGDPTQVFAYHRAALERCFLTVRLFYGLCLYELVQQLPRLSSLMQAKGMDPLWPVSFVPLVGSRAAAGLLFPLAALLAGILTIAPQKRVLRGLFAVLIVLVGAYLNSFGKINHDWHAAIVIAFFFAFLPAGDPAQLRKSFHLTRDYVLTFSLALAGFFLCYSISGFWKVTVGLYQVSVGEVHAFHPEALAYHVSRRLAQTQSKPTALAELLIQHPWAGYGPYLATLYAEVFAVLAAFRIRTHRLTGLLLLAFHMGSALTLKIGFYHHQLLLLVMAVGSPLAPSQTNWRAVVFDMPLVGDILSLLSRRRPNRLGLSHLQ